MQTLKRSSRGEDVKTLQKALNLYPDGIFGKLTEESVKAFQCGHNLKADGIVGPKTWEVILRQPTPSASASTVAGIKKSTRNIKEIIVHCSATREGQSVTVEQIRQWHTTPVSKGGRGWSNIGYHYVIYLDGSIHLGRDVNISGAHCTNHNSYSIGICYVGGTEKNDVNKPKDTRTTAQKAALLKLLKELRQLYPNARIYGHRNFSTKACPSFDAKTEYSNI